MATDANVDTIKPYQANASEYSFRHTETTNLRFDVVEAAKIKGKIIKVEAKIEAHDKLMDDIRGELRSIRSDLQSAEKRIIDKLDENQKWLVSLIISSILIPLLIALASK